MENAINFREIRCGSIASGRLYRSSHPIRDNKQEREISLLSNNARIATVLNLSDTDSELKRKIILAPWYNRLYKQGSVIALGMTYHFLTDTFCKKLQKGIRFMLEHEAPFLIHCHAGIDRTGFVAAILEAFMNANLQEIAEDYAKSFIIETGNTKIIRYTSDIEQPANNSEKSYTYIHNMFVEISNSDFHEDEIKHIAEEYILKKIKLTVSDITKLREKLGTI